MMIPGFRRWRAVLLIGLSILGMLLSVPLSDPATALATGGPWLVYSVWPDPNPPGAMGLWIASPDGSRKKQVSPGTLIDYMAASPTGGNVAFISAEPDPVRGEKHDMLNLLTLPDGRVKAITPLTTAATEMKAPGDLGAATAFAEWHTPLQWSPDGQMLAFIGAQGESNTSDLFLYSLKTNKVTQLSSGPSQAIAPSWSPDGKYILHFGLKGFGTGAGEIYAGVWVARADGSGVTTLYVPTGRGEESLGWVDASTFLVWTWEGSCGAHLIRSFNVDTGDETVWVKDYYRASAFAPEAGVLVFSVRATGSLCENQFGEGLYRMAAADRKPVRIGDATPNPLQWSPEANAFFGVLSTRPRSLIRITPDGQISGPLGDLQDIPAVSPDGKFWAWVDEDNYLQVADSATLTPTSIADHAWRVIWAH